MPASLTVQALTSEAFRPFGQVICTEGAQHFPINGGTTERFHDLCDLRHDGAGKLIVSIFRGKPLALPLTLTMVERHPLGSQAFIPLSGRPYLVVVAPGGDIPGEPQVFLARGDQGVNYAPGAWHHPLLALDGVSDFLVIDRSGPGDNCQEYTYPAPWQILQLP